MPQWSLTHRAKDDIVQLYRQGRFTFGEAQAEIYHAGLFEKFGFLARHPQIYRERKEISPPIRVCRYESHMILFIVNADKEDKTVTILRIRHSREDWQLDPLEDM